MKNNKQNVLKMCEARISDTILP